MQDFVCALLEWSLFLPVLWKSYNQIPLTFKVRFSGNSYSLFQIPSLGTLMWGSESSQQWENFFGIIVLQFVHCSPSVYGIWFYHICAPPTHSNVLACRIPGMGEPGGLSSIGSHRVGHDWSDLAGHSHCSLFFVFEHGLSFFLFSELQHSPVNGCSTASWNFGALAEEMSACTSTPPSSTEIWFVAIFLWVHLLK